MRRRAFWASTTAGSRFALAACLLCLLVLGLGDARAAQQVPGRYAHAYDQSGTFGGEIYGMNVDGSGQVNLTNDPSTDDAYPGWSNDGASIVYTSISQTGNAEIWAMNADGSGKHNLTNDPSANDFDPEWSPDGSDRLSHVRGNRYAQARW